MSDEVSRAAQNAAIQAQLQMNDLGNDNRNHVFTVEDPKSATRPCNLRRVLDSRKCNDQNTDAFKQASANRKEINAWFNANQFKDLDAGSSDSDDDNVLGNPAYGQSHRTRLQHEARLGNLEEKLAQPRPPRGSRNNGRQYAYTNNRAPSSRYPLTSGLDPAREHNARNSQFPGNAGESQPSRQILQPQSRSTRSRPNAPVENGVTQTQGGNRPSTPHRPLNPSNVRLTPPALETRPKKRPIDAAPSGQENGQERLYKYPSTPNSKKTKGSKSPASKPGSFQANVSSPRKSKKASRKVQAPSQMSRPIATTQPSRWNGPLQENLAATTVLRTPASMSTEAEMREHRLTAALFKPSSPVQASVEVQPAVSTATTAVHQKSPTDTVKPEETIKPPVVQRGPVREVRNLLEESDEEQVELRTKFAAMEVTPKTKAPTIKGAGLAASKFAIKPTPPASVASSTPAASEAGRVHESATSSAPAFWAWKATQVPKNLIRSGY